jgi:hypothetical protein
MLLHDDLEFSLFSNRKRFLGVAGATLAAENEASCGANLPAGLWLTLPSTWPFEPPGVAGIVKQQDFEHKLYHTATIFSRTKKPV